MAVAFGALGFLTSIDECFKGVIAFFADVFVNGHGETSYKSEKQIPRGKEVPLE